MPHEDADQLKFYVLIFILNDGAKCLCSYDCPSWFMICNTGCTTRVVTKQIDVSRLSVHLETLGWSYFVA